MTTFRLHGEQYDTFDHPYNTTALNERAVEIPVAWRWIERHGISTELGNVLAHYGPTSHRIIDRYEVAPGVENLDVLELAEPLGSTVAISTLEHVRMDEPEQDPLGAVRALELVRELSTALLVTVPLGCNPELDRHLLDGAGATRCATLLRAAGGGWVQTLELEPAPYGVDTPWAGAVWIGEWT